MVKVRVSGPSRFHLCGNRHRESEKAALFPHPRERSPDVPGFLGLRLGLIGDSSIVSGIAMLQTLLTLPLRH